jgi:ferredoxin
VEAGDDSPPDVDERLAGDLTVRIDRTLCVGFGECVDAAPAAFRLDREDLVVFVDPARSPREQLIEACEVCPVDAITVLDAGGAQIAP